SSNPTQFRPTGAESISPGAYTRVLPFTKVCLTLSCIAANWTDNTYAILVSVALTSQLDNALVVAGLKSAPVAFLRYKLDRKARSSVVMSAWPSLLAQNAPALAPPAPILTLPQSPNIASYASRV